MLGDQIQRVAKQPLLPARRSARLQEKIDRVQCVLEETEPQPDHISSWFREKPTPLAAPPADGLLEAKLTPW